MHVFVIMLIKVCPHHVLGPSFIYQIISEEEHTLYIVERGNNLQVDIPSYICHLSLGLTYPAMCMFILLSFSYDQ